MQRNPRRVSYVVVLFFTVCSLLSAQERHRIAGMVISAAGSPLAGALVVLEDGTGAVCGRDGRFVLKSVPPGDHVLKVRHVGFEPATIAVRACAACTSAVVVKLDDRVTVSPGVVVTAMRGETAIARCPAAVDVIDGDELRARRSRLLGDLLAEQTGVAVRHDHGAGVQLQGMDADYTLVLIDGVPMIGRSAGTLDLQRVALEGVDRVEIVKGPSSSLYGSEALAGVINVITSAPAAGPGCGVGIVAGSYGLLDLSLRGELPLGRVRLTASAQRIASGGYDLDPATIAPTVAPSENYYLRQRTVVDADSQTTLSLQLMLATTSQHSRDDLLDAADTVRANNDVRSRDWTIALGMDRRMSATVSAGASANVTRYAATNVLADTGREYYRSEFEQLRASAELRAIVAPASGILVTSGLGGVCERMVAERIGSAGRTAAGLYAFTQAGWEPEPELDVVLGARLDHHDDYGMRISPKLALGWRPTPTARGYANVGTGFKTPTFQQRYLDFTNPQVGYSVFGSAELAEGMRRSTDAGLIREVLVPAEEFEPLRPEYSLAVNAGVEFAPWPWAAVRCNAYLNDVRDLIETLPVARKHNGQSVFSYANLDRVVTRGIDAELRLQPLDDLTIHIGYHFLDAYQTDVVARIAAGEIMKVGATGRVRAVQPVEYGGLFNRSRHSGVARITWAERTTGLSVSIRASMLGRYGYADRNGNAVLDDEGEYAPGYTILNAAVGCELWHGLEAHAVLDNVLDVRGDLLPQFPGRTVSAGVAWRFQRPPASVDATKYEPTFLETDPLNINRDLHR